MCIFCDQRQAVDDVCDKFNAVLTGTTEISMVVLVGDETHEPMQDIINRSHHIRAELQACGLTSHAHRGNFKSQHFLTVLFNPNPGSNPTNLKH